MAKQEPYWDGVWAYPLMSVDYKELELKYAGALVTRFRRIVMPVNNWHHIVVFIDGVKELDKIKVTRIPRKKPSDSQAFIPAGILFVVGIFSILVGFGSLLSSEPIAETLFLFIVGAMLATAGLVSWMIGIKNHEA